MARAEFSRKTHAAVWLRARGKCEGCGARFKTGEGELDHILPCALGGSNDAENAQLLCRICHGGKTAKDINRIRKADRMRDKHNGSYPSPLGNARLRSAPFPKSRIWQPAENREDLD